MFSDLGGILIMRFYGVKKELNEDQTSASPKYKKPSPFQDLASLYFKLRYLLYIDNDRLLSPLLINQETLSV